jgi:DNA polymerase III delta subunit
MELITMFNREDPLYNPFYIVNELNKLITYSFPNPIDTSVIENLIDNKVDTVIFNLVNHLLLHEGDKMLKLYENLLLSAGNTPSKLTCIIASQLFRLKMVKVNMVKHLNPYEFLPKIKLSLPWYNINRSILENTTVEQLNLLLKKLYTLDYNILVGTVHSQYALKTFLLQNV